MVWPLICAVWALGCAALAWRFPLHARQSGLSLDLSDAESDAARLVAINDALDDVEFELTRYDRWPRAGGWLAVCGGVSITIVQLIAERYAAAATCAVITVGAIAACAIGARAGRAAAAQKRSDVDKTIAARAGDLYHQELVIPQRRAHRRRAR